MGASLIPLYMLELVTFDLYSGGIYTPLGIFSKEEAIQTYLRENTGTPLAAYLEKAPNPVNNILHVLPTPNAASTCRFTYQRMLYDADSPAGNPDFPGHWNKALILGTAETLAGEYGAPDFADIVVTAKEALMKANAGSKEKLRPTRPIKIRDY